MRSRRELAWNLLSLALILTACVAAGYFMGGTS